MDGELKQESPYEQLVVLDEVGRCCFLCQDGEKVFQTLVDHFRDNHYEDYLQLPDDSIVQLCSCPDAIQLQFKLINHMLSKSLSAYKNVLPAETEVLEFPTESPQETLISTDDLSIAIEILEDSPIKKKRRTKQEVEEDTEAVQCEQCPRLFSNVRGLQRHYLLMHEPSNPFKCKVCTVGHCKTQRSFAIHLKTHEEDLTVEKSCPECDKKWQTDNQLYHHMLIHKQKKLECDHCGMRFNMKNTLMRHILTHFKKFRKPSDKSEKKITICQFCSMSISFYNLKRHIRTSHSENKKIHKCDFDGCGKSFTESQTLKDHKNLHLGLKPYACEHCNMAFPHIATLRRHRYRHTNPDKYKCQTCGECFVTKKSLTNHVERQHNVVGNDAKPWACDFPNCTSTFRYENYLQNHKRDVHVKKRNRVRGGREKVEFSQESQEEFNESST